MIKNIDYRLQVINKERLLAEIAIKKWSDIIIKIYQLSCPSYILNSDGLQLVSDGLSDYDHTLISFCEENINNIINKYEKNIRKYF
jgi:hypothetical protein